MKWILRILIALGVLAFLLVALTLGRLFIGDGPPTCTVAFASDSYRQAALFEARMEGLGYAAELQGERGSKSGPSEVTVDDDDLFLYGSASELRLRIGDELVAVGGGGKIQSCEDTSLTG